MNLALRTATADDLATIHAIRRDAILGIRSELGANERRAWADARSPEFYAARLAAADIVMASSDGSDVGWGSSSADWITGLYVRTSAAGVGIGRALMSRLEAEIVRRGHSYARLESSPNAVGFYAKLGYTRLELPVGIKAIVMEKTLDAALRADSGEQLPRKVTR